MSTTVRWFRELGLDDVESVGGKNASLGEMVQHLSAAGVAVPDGFATTAEAYRRFLGDTGLAERISTLLRDLDVDDTRRLAEVGREIREAVEAQEFPEDLERDIRAAYEQLVGEASDAGGEVSWAVRSSATAEDLPDASFAGQQETFLNVRGIENVLHAIRLVFASLYNDRAIAYRVHSDFDHDVVALSAGVQRMVRSDVGASGVMFTIDTESGFEDAVFITSAYGLGEGVVQGAVNPDEFYVHKPALRAGRTAILKRGVGAKATKMVYTDDATVGRTTEFVPVEAEDQRRLSLTDDEVTELARTALRIEEHYGRPMDIEWGRDGVDGRIYVLQARPETVKSRAAGGVQQRFRLEERGPVVVEGRAIGQKIGAGAVRVLSDVGSMHEFVPGEVLVADMTDPDWEPIMKRAAAIVTNRGGRTCHAAIIARELGIPAVVGTGSATTELADGREVTVSCAEGDTGYVYDGLREFSVAETTLEEMPEIPTRIMMNVGTRSRPSSSRACRTGASGWRAWSSSSTGRSASTPGPCSSSRTRSRPCAPRSRSASPPTPGPASSSSSAWPRGSRCSRPPSRPSRSSCASRTSSPTSTPACSAASATNRTRRTRCWATAARPATCRRSSPRASRWSARRCATCATRWA